MKKHLFLIFGAFLLAEGLLFASPGGSLTARAADENLWKGGSTQFQPLNSPPAKVCVDDQFPINVGVLFRNLKVVHVTAVAKGGILIGSSWTFQEKQWVGIATSFFTAKEKGPGSVVFRAAEGGAKPVTFTFTIEDCTKYTLIVATRETVYSDPWSWEALLNGTADVISENGQLSGKGSFTLSVLFHIKDSDSNRHCTTTQPLQGEGSITVSGTQSKNTFKVTPTFDDVEISGGEFECEDTNGRVTKDDLPDIFKGKVKIQAYLSLTTVSLTPWKVHPFTFSKTGRGAIYMYPGSE
jgi:hypothetical protein